MTTDTDMLFTAIASGDLVQVTEILTRVPHLLDARLKGSEETPLHLAASQGQYDVVKFLISKGANVHAQAALDFTPLDAAQQNGHGNIARLLRDNGGESYA